MKSGCSESDQMPVVIVGHVDHGKSTVIGRLLADTGSLPKGKLDEVKERCARSARPFEYAFLLDALKDEQAQGITIDSARTFFRTGKRRYMVVDAPGHIDFLKNMVTGAAQAEAALLVIDAHEGIKENSLRHGYLLSMLGVRQIAVVVNKMDLVGYSHKTYDGIVSRYGSFLKNIGITPKAFIPACAREGENIAARSGAMAWYAGPTVLEQLDLFEPPVSLASAPFRFPVQDVYKFTEEGDERRIVAGTIQSGSIRVGDAVTFFPSGGRSRVASVEEFNAPARSEAHAGRAPGFTLTTQVYIKPGELMAKDGELPPKVSNRFRANIFWMGKNPLIKGKYYKLKVAAARVHVQVHEIVTVIDALELSALGAREQVDTYDVAEVILESAKPVAFDLAAELVTTGRFVIVDDYEISAGGVILEALAADDVLIKGHTAKREFSWVRGMPVETRSRHYAHKPVVVFLTGPRKMDKISIAKDLEMRLVDEGRKAYFLGIANIRRGLNTDIIVSAGEHDEHLRRLGELARIMFDAGLIFIATASDLDGFDIKMLRDLSHPADSLVVLLDDAMPEAYRPDLLLDPGQLPAESAGLVISLLRKKGYIS